MNQSDTVSKLAAALVAAQAAMPEVPMDGMNPHYRSKFSTLGAVIKATRPIFSKHGLAVLQLPSGGNGEIGLTTRIVHTSGEWIEQEAKMTIPGNANPGQEFGKLITYLRRYSLASAAGVYSDEDTDNESKADKKVQPAKVTAPPAPVDVDGTEMVTIMGGDTIKAVVALNIFDAEQAAAQVLAKLFPKQRKAPMGKIVEVSQLYRDNKDACKDTDKAIAATLAGEVL
jgi:hypothetical protein